MAETDLTIERHENASNGGESGEYLARIPGSDATGKLTWVKRGDARVAEHTLVPGALRGQGIAAELVKALVADARERVFRIVPACSYVAAKFDENPDWSDLRA
ncbi:GNAT family N-acetyltransferase [Qipengyuania sp. SM2507]